MECFVKLSGAFIPFKNFLFVIKEHDRQKVKEF